MKTLKLGEESLTKGEYKMLTEEAKQKMLEFSDEAGDEEAVVELPDGLLFLNITEDDTEDERWNNFSIKVSPTLIGFADGIKNLDQPLICPSCFEETTIADQASEFYDCELPQRSFKISGDAHVRWDFWYKRVEDDDEAREIAETEAEDPASGSDYSSDWGGEGDFSYCAMSFWNHSSDFPQSWAQWVLEFEDFKINLYSEDHECGAFFDIENQTFQLIHAETKWNSFEMIAGDSAYVRKKEWKHSTRGEDSKEYDNFDPKLLKVFGSFNFEVWAMSYDDEPIDWDNWGDDQECDEYYYFDGSDYKNLMGNSWGDDDDDEDEDSENPDNESGDDSNDDSSDGPEDSAPEAEEDDEDSADDEIYTGEIVLCRDGMTAQNKSHLEQIIQKVIEEDGADCDLNFIDVSNIRNMSFLFNYSEFNGDISGWNVSNVKDMSCMFQGCQFNGDISNWDVSNVKDMSSMFQESAFDGDLSNWNVEKVKTMNSMFSWSSFNSDLSRWKVGKGVDTANMFDETPLAKSNDLPKWYKK